MVETAVNHTGFTLEREVTSLLTEELRARLRERDLLETSSDAAADDGVVVKIAVIAYASGNALKRWVAPGWGTTFCTVRTTLVDRAGNTLGEIVVDKSIGSGGLYTVGAGEWIIGATARAIADEIARKLGTTRP